MPAASRAPRPRELAALPRVTGEAGALTLRVTHDAATGVDHLAALRDGRLEWELELDGLYGRWGALRDHALYALDGDLLSLAWTEHTRHGFVEARVTRIGADGVVRWTSASAAHGDVVVGERAAARLVALWTLEGAPDDGADAALVARDPDTGAPLAHVAVALPPPWAGARVALRATGGAVALVARAATAPGAWQRPLDELL